jgi:ribonuclease P protein subunit RPR2
MARARKKQKFLIKDLAKQRIEHLFELAGDAYKSYPERSNRYVSLARKIGMRYRIRIPREYKQRICKQCHSYLVPGSNARFRLRRRYVTVTCLTCNKQMRYPYKRNRETEKLPAGEK